MVFTYLLHMARKQTTGGWQTISNKIYKENNYNNNHMINDTEQHKQ